MDKKQFLLIGFLFLLTGSGCIQSDSVVMDPSETIDSFVEVVFPGNDVQLPVEEYFQRRDQKVFGEYIEDRFMGYHIGDDIEFTDISGSVPVYAIADGEIIFRDWVSGYGGVMLIRHEIADQEIHAIYGHVDLNSALNLGFVEKGVTIASLGEHESEDTDQERKHLHFALYQGEDVRLQGYELDDNNIHDWINPSDFFLGHGISSSSERPFPAVNEAGSDIFSMEFMVPEGMEVEYIPSIQSLNIFLLAGDSEARARSQIFIRYFDAAEFLTLNSVDILEEENLTIGIEDYEAKRYDIVKKDGYLDFIDQPEWRNTRHIVTDIRKNADFGRYFVIAKNPDLEDDIYEEFLDSIYLR